MQHDIENILSERDTRYGGFENNARLSQELKSLMQQSRRWKLLSNVQREALENVVMKMARILNGDPLYLDNWIDMAGYISLAITDMKASKFDAPKNKVRV